MLQPMMIDHGSRTLIEQIATRTKKDLPVVIEMTALRRVPSAGRNYIDAINYFEGVIERLDRTMPSGWSRSPTWSELGRGRSRKNASRRLYLYVQARIGLAEMHRIDAAAAELARSMNLRYGLAMAPGIAMTSCEIAGDRIDAARKELLRLIPDDPNTPLASGRYSVRARWINAGRPKANDRVVAGMAPGMAPETDRRSHRARLYLTLLRRRSTSRRVPARTRLDAARPARLSERRVPRSSPGRLVAGHVDPP